jgi:hypothetical protein
MVLRFTSIASMTKESTNDIKPIDATRIQNSMSSVKKFRANNMDKFDPYAN